MTLQELADGIADQDVNTGFRLNENVIVSNSRVGVARFRRFKLPKKLYHGTFTRNLPTIKTKGLVSNNGELWFAPVESGSLSHVINRLFWRVRRAAEGKRKKGPIEEKILRVSTIMFDLGTEEKKQRFLEEIDRQGLKLHKDIGGAFVVSRTGKGGGGGRDYKILKAIFDATGAKTKTYGTDYVIKALRKVSNAKRGMKRKKYALKVLQESGPKLAAARREGAELDRWQKYLLSLCREYVAAKSDPEKIDDIIDRFLNPPDPSIKPRRGRKVGRKIEAVLDAVEKAGFDKKKDVGFKRVLKDEDDVDLVEGLEVSKPRKPRKKKKVRKVPIKSEPRLKKKVRKVRKDTAKREKPRRRKKTGDGRVNRILERAGLL